MSTAHHLNAGSHLPPQLTESGEPDIYQYGYPRVDTSCSPMAYSSPKSYPFLDTYDELALLEGGLYQKTKYGDMGDYYNYHKMRANDDDHHHDRRKSIDPRLIILLEFFRELFIRRREVLKKLFPQVRDEFVEMFKKIGGSLGKLDHHHQVNEVRTRGLQRSLSVGSPRAFGDEPPLRLERFKIRTVLPSGAEEGGSGGGGGGAGGQGGIKQSGGSQSK